MQTKSLLISLLTLFCFAQAKADVIINSNNFPDEIFRKYLKEQPYGEDGVITDEEIASITELYITNLGISSLKGIESFYALTRLYCDYNQLTSIDVSKNTKLYMLGCSFNQLTSIDVSKNTELIGLSCYNNQLTSIDVSKNTKLEWLSCYGNQLTSIDVSKNSELSDLSCGYNQLTSLDVSKNKKLEFLSCSSNQLTSLDVSKNKKLKDLQCYSNQIRGGAMDELVESLPTLRRTVNLPIINNTNEGNEITTDQVEVAKAKGWIPQIYNDESGWQDYTGIERTIRIDKSYFPDEKFQKYLKAQSYGRDGIITNEEIAEVTTINVANSGISDLKGIKYFTALTELRCEYNQLSALDLSKNTSLEILHCYYNHITPLILPKNTKLKELQCYSNQIKGVYMELLVNDLPNLSDTRDLLVINNASEGNEMDIHQVEYAKTKGWMPKMYEEKEWHDYAGTERIISVDELYFPDENFCNYLKEKSYSEDGIITKEEIADITNIDIEGLGVSDLSGISYFTALRELSCGNNQLKSIDVSKNTELRELYCYNNQLTSIDVSKNTELQYLSCSNNQLTSIDVSKNTKLYALNCGYNQLTSLDVSKNTELEYLYCYSNQLTSLDVSKNTKLEYLSCEGNQLTSLDVSKNTALEVFSCSYNQLTSLDVSKNTELTGLNCYDNQLTSLDVSKNTELTSLSCEDNQLTSLDVSKNTELEYLYCYSNQLTSIDVSKNTKLYALNCGYNQLTSLDVSKNTKLEWMSCYGNQLTSIDVSKNAELRVLSCHYNQLTSIDVSKNTKLEELYCYSNQIKGEAMEILVEGLPTLSEPVDLPIINNTNEGNEMTIAQVEKAKAKGWIPQIRDEYKGWLEYAGSDTAIESIMVDDTEIKDIYSIGGQRLETLHKGLNIIRMSNGKTKKVVVR